jgi:nicotinate-nucleotide pyrophosphorylase (carboxylating)
MVVDDSVLALIERALAEDIGTGDVTTDSTVGEAQLSKARIVARGDGVIAGLPVAGQVFRALDASIVVEALCPDGSAVSSGATVAKIDGRTRAILTGERVALNFLQRLSGIATLTSSYVAALRGSSARLLDTRKTTPGMRALEKYAVSVGGGHNHRMGLWDMALIKDNHIVAASGISSAVARVRETSPGLRIEVEVTSVGQLTECLNAGVDRVMLDNMTLEDMREAISVARSRKPSPEIEISGGVDLSDVGAIARLNPDFVSVGAITHSAPAFDLSLEMEAGR